MPIPSPGALPGTDGGGGLRLSRHRYVRGAVSRHAGHTFQNYQAQSRLSVKIRSLAGIAYRLAEMIGIAAIPAVREELGWRWSIRWFAGWRLPATCRRLFRAEQALHVRRTGADGSSTRSAGPPVGR